MKAHRNSRKNVTEFKKLGNNQKQVIYCLRELELSFSELVKCTGLHHSQVSEAARKLVADKVIEHCWAKDGRAVYRLKGK